MPFSLLRSLLPQEFPIRAWKEHSREVFSVDWSNIKKDVFASSSWDNTIKIARSHFLSVFVSQLFTLSAVLFSFSQWSPESPRSLLTIPAHSHCMSVSHSVPTHRLRRLILILPCGCLQLLRAFLTPYSRRSRVLLRRRPP